MEVLKMGSNSSGKMAQRPVPQRPAGHAGECGQHGLQPADDPRQPADRLGGGCDRPRRRGPCRARRRGAAQRGRSRVFRDASQRCGKNEIKAEKIPKKY